MASDAAMNGVDKLSNGVFDLHISDPQLRDIGGMQDTMNQMVPPMPQGQGPYMGMNPMHSGSLPTAGAPPPVGFPNGLPNMQGPSNASGAQMYQQGGAFNQRQPEQMPLLPGFTRYQVLMMASDATAITSEVMNEVDKLSNGVSDLQILDRTCTGVHPQSQDLGENGMRAAAPVQGISSNPKPKKKRIKINRRTKITNSDLPELLQRLSG